MPASPLSPPAPADCSCEAAPAVVEEGRRIAPARRPAHVPVGPLEVFDGGLDEAASLCLEAIRCRRGLRVATANLDFVARARRDAQLRRDLADASLVVADGAPVAWLARVAGGGRTRRVTGVDLVAALCERGAAHGLRVALYGSDPATALAAAERIEVRYNGVRVVDVLCPPFRPLSDGEVRHALARLAASQPDLVLVALGCPRQERFIAEYARALPHATWIGVGGTFDFFAGKRRRAPRALQAVGGEWLARLAQEPRRLWRRYLVDDLPGLFRVTPAALRQRRRVAPGELDDLRRALLEA